MGGVVYLLAPAVCDLVCVGEAIMASVITLHAAPTSTLLHAEETAGERNTLYLLATLTDEDGDVLVDQNGDTLIAFGETPVVILHAAPTSTLIHAEET